MKHYKINLAILLATFFFIFPLFGKAQNADIDLLENINPQNPNSFIWKTASSTTYPVAIALPVGLWVDGTLKHNKKTQYRAYELAGSVIIAGIGSQGSKIIFNRQRPYEKYNTIYPYQVESSSSFPSNHASIAFAVATSVSIQYKKWYIVVPAYVWAAGVGYSRLYLGEHYPTDVVAGAAVGAGSAIISHWISKKIFK